MNVCGRRWVIVVLVVCVPIYLHSVIKIQIDTNEIAGRKELRSTTTTDAFPFKEDESQTASDPETKKKASRENRRPQPPLSITMAESNKVPIDKRPRDDKKMASIENAASREATATGANLNYQGWIYQSSHHFWEGGDSSV